MPIRVTTDGEIVVMAGGEIATAEAGAETGCCCEEAAENCDSIATCNKWCYPNRQDGGAERAECCECPCPGRKCLPPAWDTEWRPVLRTGERIRITGTGADEWRGTPGAEWYCTITGTTPYSTRCGVVPPDDATEGSTGLSAFIEVETPGGGPTYTATCPVDYAGDGGNANVFCTNGLVRFSGDVQVQIVGKPMNDPDSTMVTLGDVKGHVMTGTDPATGEEIIDTGQSCCIAGSSDELPVKVQFLTGDAWTFWDISSPATASWEPSCVDCNGAPLQTDDGPEASICAVPTVAGYLWNGEYDIDTGEPIFEYFSEEMEQISTCFWSSTFTTETITGNLAIQPVNLADPDDGCGDEEHLCNQQGIVWKLTVSHSGDFVRLLNTGSCPPDEEWTDVDVDTLPDPTGPEVGWKDIFVTYTGECPPP